MGQVEEKTDEKIEDIADPIGDIMEKVEEKVEEEVEETTEEPEKDDNKDDKEDDKKSEEDKKEKKEKDTKGSEKKKKDKKKPAKKKSSAIVVSALIILAVLLLIGGIFALRKMRGSIVGSWEYKLTESDNSVLKNASQEFVFNEDGTMQANSYVNGIIFYTTTGTYEIKNGKLYCTLDKTGETSEAEFKLKGDKLIFYNKSGEEQVFLKKDTK